MPKVIQIVIKLLRFIKVFFFNCLLTLIKKIPFFEKILRKICGKCPKLSRFVQKIENSGGFSLLLGVLHKSSKLTKIAKFVYFKFPGFSRFVLKLFNVGGRDPIDLQTAIKGKKTPKFIQNEIDVFLKDLKLVLHRDNK